MLKKIFVLLVLLLGVNCYAFDFTDNNINILKITGGDRYEYIQNIRPMVITTNFDKKITSKEFKEIVNCHKKDSNYPYNYYATQSGYTSLRRILLSPVYYNNTDIMTYYTVQEPENPRIVYYYSILGNLKFVGLIQDTFPAYPYIEKKYRTNGNFVDITYHINETTKVIFNKKGSQASIYYNNKLLEKLKF